MRCFSHMKCIDRLHHEVFPSHEIHRLLNETDERVAAAAVSSKYF